MKLIIINGTLCSEALWADYIVKLQSLVDSPIEILFADIASKRQSIDNYVQEIGSTIANYKDDNVWVLGYSLGGIIALELAKQYQQYMAGMLLMCTNHYGQTTEKQEGVRTQLDMLDTEGLETVFNNILLPAYFGDKLDEYQEEAQRVSKMGLALGEEVYKNQLFTLGTRIDQSQYLANIAIPVLLCYGEQDVLCTEAQNKEMHSLLPNSSLHKVANTRHMLPLLCASELANISAEFLQR